MSYTPTNWKTGDVITADKLNNMESGIVNASNIVTVSFTTSNDMTKLTFENTYEEIKELLDSGFNVVGKEVYKAGDSLVFCQTSSFIWYLSNSLYIYLWAPTPAMFVNYSGNEWTKVST